MPHPGCGGRLRQVDWGFCEPVEEFMEWYTAEGVLLRRERR